MYGRLYTYAAALIACPAGWHLPSNEEWGVLIKSAGWSEVAGNKLKSRTGWNYDGNGTDNFGFSALPGGLRYSDGYFYGVGNYGSWWSATEYAANYARYRYMGYSISNVDEHWYYKSNGFSVRCVKN
jgi:uncharacterized protein (TIGR02145 family)